MNTQESDFVNRDGFEQPNKTTHPPKMEGAQIHAIGRFQDFGTFILGCPTMLFI